MHFSSSKTMSLDAKFSPIFLICLLLAPVRVSAGAPQRPALRTSFEARADSVALSDLLPSEAPQSLRAAAAKIILADSPLSGAHRTLDRLQIERSLRRVPELRRALEIPPAIDVTRWSRPLTRAEVFTVVRDALRSNQIPGADSLSAQNLVFSSVISVTEDAPKLRVTRIDSSRDGSVARVRLWIASEPRIPPFWVTLTREPDRSAILAKSDSPAGPYALREIKIRVGEPSRPNSLDSSVLVKVGEPVQLILQGRGMRIATAAVPLDAGRLNQKIRVRASLTGKVLVGTVISSHTVEVHY